MKISEVFASVDGEGLRTGELATFIRTFGCNLHCSYCFAPNKKGRYPSVTLASGEHLPLDKVSAGDVILTLDENKHLVETTIIDVGKRIVKDLESIVLPGLCLKCTPEHPFYVNGKWVQAKDLNVGDECYKVKQCDYELYKVYGEKYREILVDYTKSVLTLYKDICANNVDEKNGNFNPDYCGHHYNQLKSAIRKGLCVDVLSGENVPLVVHHLDEDKSNDDIENLVIIPRSLHDRLHARGFNFRKASKSNVARVLSHTRNYGDKANKIMGNKEREVINLSCLPYNTFLVDDIYVHNCDSLYAVDGKDYKEMSVGRIMNEVQRIGYKNVTFTGGEPLMVENAELLVDSLIEQGYDVNIETNGAYDFTPYLSKKCVLCVDYKTPFSKMNKLMLEDKFELLRVGDVVKFVMAKSDFGFVKEFLRSHKIKAWVYFSPVFGEIEPCELVEFMKDLNKNGIISQKHTRVQLQLHKILWEPSKRGV